MRYTTIYLGICFLVSACGQKDILLENSWIIVDGTYARRPINFHSTDLLIFLDNNGKPIKSLKFFEDETIILPGISSPNISAKWIMDGDIIRFKVDSIRYSFYDRNDSDLSILETADSMRMEPKEEVDFEQQIVNPLATKEVKDAMEIYGQSFKYYISLDTLVLKGEKGRIRAVRDRSIDDMFRNF